MDPDNSLYWRMSPRRLEAEAIRDATRRIWVADSNLRLDHRSPGLQVVQSAPTLGDAVSGNNRSVYLPITRGAVLAFLDTFDIAEPSFVTGNRDETSVPSQALSPERPLGHGIGRTRWLQDTHSLPMPEPMKIGCVSPSCGRWVASLPPPRRVRSGLSSATSRGLDAQESAFNQPQGTGRLAETLARNPQRREATELDGQRGTEIPGSLDPREVAWSAFCQSLSPVPSFDTSTDEVSDDQ